MSRERNGSGKRSHSHSGYGDKVDSKRRHSGGERDHFTVESEDTVYRYLCPGRKIGSIIGRGGDIVKQLRVDTKSKIRIGDTIPGCEDRVITIYSSSDETNPFDDTDIFVSPAQDALFKVHDRVVMDESHDSFPEENPQATARLLVPSDQIGSVIGKGGQIIQNIRSESGAQVRILKNDHLPSCALNMDELVQISGEPLAVKKALSQIAVRLHDNPSRSQNMLGTYSSVGPVMGPSAGAPIMGLTPLVGSYGSYKGDGDWSHSFYPSRRDESSLMEFSLRLICQTEIIGGVIGKGGIIINQIRQESGANIKVDSSSVEDDCLIFISAKEYFEDSASAAIDAAVRLQPRCSERIERDSGIITFTTRLLVPSNRIGCLIGKKGSIITEIRKITKANIRILPKEDLPKIVSGDDELVQITGDLDVAKDALIQITTRLKANLFDREGSAFVPIHYLPVSTNVPGGMRYDNRESRGRGREHSYSDGYGGSSDVVNSDRYGAHGSSQSGGGSYGGGSYSSGRAGGFGYSGNPSSRRKSYGY